MTGCCVLIPDAVDQWPHFGLQSSNQDNKTTNIHESSSLQLFFLADPEAAPKPKQPIVSSSWLLAEIWRSKEVDGTMVTCSASQHGCWHHLVFSTCIIAVHHAKGKELVCYIRNFMISSRNVPKFIKIQVLWLAKTDLDLKLTSCKLHL